MAYNKNILGQHSIFYIKYNDVWCPIACEISSPMSETVEMTNTTTRDNAGWKTEKPTLQSYSIPIEGLLKLDDETEDSNILSYNKLRKMKRNRELIEWKRETLQGWYVDSGMAYITDISDSNVVGEEITFSLNLSGFGKPLEGVYWKTAKDYNHIIGYGQSLSVGETEKLITTTPPNPNLLCFDGVVRTSPYDKSLTGDIYPINRRLAFTPLVERLNDGLVATGILRETPSSGTGEMFAKSYSKISYRGLDKKIILSAPGQGAAGILNLNKGTDPYQRLIDDVTAAKALTDAMGKTYQVTAVTWTQGETDYGYDTTTANYKAYLKQMVADLNADIKGITEQTEDVILVCYQLATAKNALRDYPNIALALFECSLEDPLIYLATPMYHMKYKDGFHLRAESSKLLGAYYGDVINRIVMLNENWKPLHVESSVTDGNIITLHYHLPDGGELFFDTPNGIDLPNKGFSFSDDSDIITSVQIGTDKKSIIITCSASPAGKTLQYAVEWQTVPNTQANLGNIRDNAGENRRLTIDGFDTKMHNYAVIQEIQIYSAESAAYLEAIGEPQNSVKGKAFNDFFFGVQASNIWPKITLAKPVYGNTADDINMNMKTATPSGDLAVSNIVPGGVSVASNPSRVLIHDNLTVQPTGHVCVYNKTPEYNGIILSGSLGISGAGLSLSRYVADITQSAAYSAVLNISPAVNEVGTMLTTFDGTTAKTFSNGALIGSGAVTASAVTTESLYLGYDGYMTQCVIGFISVGEGLTDAEVAIYDDLIQTLVSKIH